MIIPCPCRPRMATFSRASNPEWDGDDQFQNQITKQSPSNHQATINHRHAFFPFYSPLCAGYRWYVVAPVSFEFASNQGETTHERFYGIIPWVSFLCIDVHIYLFFQGGGWVLFIARRAPPRCDFIHKLVLSLCPHLSLSLSLSLCRVWIHSLTRPNAGWHQDWPPRLLPVLLRRGP